MEAISDRVILASTQYTNSSHIIKRKTKQEDPQIFVLDSFAHYVMRERKSFDMFLLQKPVPMGLQIILCLFVLVLFLWFNSCHVSDSVSYPTSIYLTEDLITEMCNGNKSSIEVFNVSLTFESHVKYGLCEWAQMMHERHLVLD